MPDDSFAFAIRTVPYTAPDGRKLVLRTDFYRGYKSYSIEDETGGKLIGPRSTTQVRSARFWLTHEQLPFTPTRATVPSEVALGSSEPSLV